MNEVLEELKQCPQGSPLLAGLQKDLALYLANEVLDQQFTLRMHTYGALGLDSAKGMQVMIESHKESGDQIAHLVSAQQRHRLSGSIEEHFDSYYPGTYASHSFSRANGLVSMQTACRKSLWENTYLLGDQNAWNDADRFVRCAECEKAHTGKTPGLHAPKARENKLQSLLSNFMMETISKANSETELAVLRAKAARAYPALLIDTLIVDEEQRENMLRHLLGAHEYKKFSQRNSARQQSHYSNHTYYRREPLATIGNWMSPSEWRKHLTNYMPQNTFGSVEQALVTFQQMTVSHFVSWIGKERSL